MKHEDDIYDAVAKYRDEHPELMAQPQQKEQFSREDMFQCACEFCHILIDNENGRKHFDEWVDNYLNSKPL